MCMFFQKGHIFLYKNSLIHSLTGVCMTESKNGLWVLHSPREGKKCMYLVLKYGDYTSYIKSTSQIKSFDDNNFWDMVIPGMR